MTFGGAKLFLLGDLGLSLSATVAPNVSDGHPLFAEHAADEQPSMALGGILLATQYRHPIHLDFLQQAIQPFLKLWRLGQIAVEDVAFGIVELGLRRPPMRSPRKMYLIRWRANESSIASLLKWVAYRE